MWRLNFEGAMIGEHYFLRKFTLKVFSASAIGLGISRLLEILFWNIVIVFLPRGKDKKQLLNTMKVSKQKLQCFQRIKR